MGSVEFPRVSLESESMCVPTVALSPLFIVPLGPWDEVFVESI